MEIHVTQVNDCPRKVLYKMEGREALPYHYYSIKGILTHAVIERCLKEYGDVAIEYPALLGDRDDKEKIPEELYNKCLPEVTRLVDNFTSWVKETDIDLTDLAVEEEIRTEYQGYTIVGKPDLLDKATNTLIDFKTGKSMRNDYSIQLGGYKWLLEEEGGVEVDKAVVVLLGGSKAEEKEMGKKVLDKSVEVFKAKLDKLIGTISKKQNVGCSIGFHCVYCPYIHICRGI